MKEADQPAMELPSDRREVIWFDDWDTGAWCDECLLPSGVAVTRTHITTNWVAAPYRYFACGDCGIRKRI